MARSSAAGAVSEKESGNGERWSRNGVRLRRHPSMANSKWICYNVDDEGFHGRRQGCAEHVVVHSWLRRHGTSGGRALLLLLALHTPTGYKNELARESPAGRRKDAPAREDGLGGDVEHGGVVAAAGGLLRAVAEPRRRGEQDGGVVLPLLPRGVAAALPRNHSRESSSSRFSAAKSGSSRRTAAAGGDGGKGGVAAGRGGGGGGGGGRRSPWMKEAAIEEEGLLMEDDDADGGGGGGGGFSSLPRRWRYALGFVGAFFALFFFFALILWGASHNQKPVVSINSITFHNFVIQAGTDASLVPTELSTVNATVRMTFRNTGSFFGVHVTAEPLTLYYYQLLMASGNVKYFYQSRKSSRHVAVAVVGDKVPLYGGGSGLSSTPVKGAPPAPVPLQLAVRFRSRAFVLGKLVKPKFLTNVQCSVRLDVAKLGKPVSLNKACSLV
ncbi:hypothetical protein OsJ_14845 [Oryza sativa Japonica Group]|uniref:Late embryogenesis abundant protein LEA-2 subgroup domain-containing protein n=1 Tax=Oryza sativa subsp. japonica TaxID=39947 RepID=A3ATZ1_ORYSJ|nr:hypothetical protein OsJ_14845 [Oryza sativa Japonica Group]